MKNLSKNSKFKEFLNIFAFIFAIYITFSFTIPTIILPNYSILKLDIQEQTKHVENIIESIKYKNKYDRDNKFYINQIHKIYIIL